MRASLKVMSVINACEDMREKHDEYKKAYEAWREAYPADYATTGSAMTESFKVMCGEQIRALTESEHALKEAGLELTAR